jgi:hypothetical protein
MPGKTFEIPDPPADEQHEGLWFELKGKHRKTGEPWLEHFDIVPYVPFAVLDDLAATVNVLPSGEVTYGKAAILRYMRRAIDSDQRRVWDELLRDSDRPIDINEIAPIMLWIVGEMSERPTGPQSNSPAGSAETNGGSKGGSGSKASRNKSGKGGTRGSGST